VNRRGKDAAAVKTDDNFMNGLSDEEEEEHVKQVIDWKLL
jgi:hypothetical protein